MTQCSARNAQGLAYHRLSHSTPQAGRWWRPLAMVALAALLWVIANIVFVGLEAAVGAWLSIPHPTQDYENPRNPSDILFGFGYVAALIPVVVLTVRWAGARPGTVHSIVGRLRWGMLWRAGRIIFPAFAVANGTLFLIERPDDFSAPALSTWGWVALVVLAVVPLQAAAEEYLFRGFIPQLLGTWLRSPVWGVTLATPLFVMMHGYDAWGLIDIGVFALCAAYLVWLTGGLELSIVLHAANNVSLLLLAPLSPSSLHQGATDPWGLLVSLPMTIGATWWLARFAKRELDAGDGATHVAEPASSSSVISA